MILVFAENIKGTFKKASFEAISLASDLSKQTNNAPVCVVCLGESQPQTLASLGKYGASKVINVADSRFDNLDAQAFAKAIADVAQKINATIVVLASTYTGKAIAPRIAIRLNAGFASDIIALPTQSGDRLLVRKTCFSNKGFAEVSVSGAIKVLSVSPNSYPITETDGTASVEDFVMPDSLFATQVVGQDVSTGKIPLTEAELVVSGGRGLKGPENWFMIENLATTLGAATACSKPVSDMDWRSHDEHVGQTGITIKPNLYIACGISGAIQHLAGVSGSKIIVAINSDKEAPFFKIANYGVVGDVFEVLPKLNDALKKYKAANA